MVFSYFHVLFHVFYLKAGAKQAVFERQVSRQAGAVEQMQQEIDNLGGGRLVDSVLRLEKGLDLEELRGRGLAMVKEAHERAARAEQAATEEIEKLSERLQEIMKQVTESESFKVRLA